MHAYMYMRIFKRYVYELWDSGDRSGFWPLVFGIQAKQVMLICIQYSCTMLYNKDRCIIMYGIQVCKLYNLTKVVNP